MIRTLSPPVRKAAALGLLLLACSAVWVHAVDPVIEKVRQDRAILAQAQSLGARHGEVLRQIAEAGAELEALRRNASASGHVLEGASEALIAATLQERIKTLVQQTRATLKSTDILPGKADGGYQRVAIRVAVQTDIEALKTVLYRLEQSDAYLFLDNIDIGAQVSRSQSGGQSEMLLDVRFDIYGYARVGS